MFSLMASAKSKKGSKDKDKDSEKESELKLPPIVVDAAGANNEEDDDERNKANNNNNKKKERDKEKEEKDFPKPHDFDFWVRTLDTTNNSLYYYNTKTGESAWLAPCSVCFRGGEKWCIDCETTFCDKHFAKKHRNEKDPNHALLRTHKWAKNETNTEREPLEQQGDAYCIECGVKVATKLCDTCWDAYCTRCFELVHHVGALKLHKGVNYRRAKKQWYCVKQASPEPDYFVNGANGEKTFDKPTELMTELERVLSENFKTHKIAAEEYVKKVEELQFELEKVRYERDNLLFENAQLQNSRSKPESSAASTGKQSNDDYRQKLMNPSDRRRGEAKNNKIKELIDLPIPTSPTK